VKTAISIPDRVFVAAERASRRLGISRSQFYSKAVEAFLKTQRGQGIKAALNAVYATEDSRLDPVLAAMQEASLRGEDW
jgi:metal-responsive CopG/Arc/MetJ family transcriptional regulator